MEQDIYIEQIHLDRAWLRESVTEESVEILSRSIQHDGLLQAIVVTPREGGGYRLVAGRRRLAACKLLQYSTIPCRIIEDPGLDEIPALAENLMRLNMNPLEEARACKILHEEKGLTISEICERTNHGTSWVQDRLALLALPEHFQRAISEKKLSIGAAFQLCEITDTEYRDYLLQIAKINGATTQQCEGWYLEWKAREQFTNPHGQSNPIPQLPPRPLRTIMACTFCDEETEIDMSILIRICSQCATDINTAKMTRPSNKTIDLDPEKKTK